MAEARWLDNGVRLLPWWGGVSNDDQLIKLEDSGGAVDFRGRTFEMRSEGKIELEDVATSVCMAADTTVEALRGRSRSVDVAAAGKAFAIAAVEHLGHDVADVAVFLRKHPGSVSRWLETPTGTGHAPGLVQHLLELLAADFDVVSAGM